MNSQQGWMLLEVMFAFTVFAFSLWAWVQMMGTYHQFEGALREKEHQYTQTHRVFIQALLAKDEGMHEKD